MRSIILFMVWMLIITMAPNLSAQRLSDSLTSKNGKMRIEKKMFDEELRPTYRIGKMMSMMLRKKWGVKMFNKMIDKPSKGKSIEGIDCSEMMIPSNNGDHEIRVRVFKPANTNGPLPGMLFLHGGGYIVGTPEQFLDIIKGYIQKRPCIIVAPDYRKALKNPFPDGFNDCYDALLWMKNYGDSIGIDSNKLIVAGNSAGGGLAVATALKARDTKSVSLKFQMPIYPMLDDRQQTESARLYKGAPMWDTRNSAFAWDLYLKRLTNNNDSIPTYAAPAREVDYSDLPPTITFFGDSEPFRDEDLHYMENLKEAGVPVTYKMFKGAFHGFEMARPEARISKDAIEFLLNAYGTYYDQYLLEE